MLDLLIVLFTTKLAGDASIRLKQPAVLGKLIVGILIGPALLGWVDSREFLDTLSAIGVLLLMFIAGLETNLQDLNRSRNSAVAVAVGGLILPLAGGYLAALQFGMQESHALFLGLLLAATSVSISVQTLKELGYAQTQESVTILGAALVDDILIVVSLAFLLSVVGGSEIGLGMVVAKKIFFFAAVIVLGWKVVPTFLRLFAPLNVTEATISAALIVCFAFSYLAEWLGVAGIIGAFAAGIAVSQTSFKEEVEHKLEPIAYTIFVPVFFVSIGFSVSFEGLSSSLWFIVAVTLLSIVTKWLGAGLGAKLTGFSTASAAGIGAGMVSRGEVALILAIIGQETGLLPPTYFTAVLLVVILTTLVTPPLLKQFFPEQE